MPMLVAEIGLYDENQRKHRLVYEVVDGTQRLRTMQEFIGNKFKLNDLDKLTEFEGVRFMDMEPYMQSKFKNIDLRVQIVTDKASASIRADIFNRLNTSGKKLTPSEIRKGSYAGKCYDTVLKLAQNDLFQQLCPVGKKGVDRGEKEELVLRYLVYSKFYLDFKHDVTNFLDSKLVALNNDETYDPKQDELDFERMLQFVCKYFPSPYFATKSRPNTTARVRFEAIAVGVHLALQMNSALVPASMDWLESGEFKDHTTTDASNNQGKLRDRIEFVRNSLLGSSNNETNQNGTQGEA